MKRISLTLLAVLMIFAGVSAQQAKTPVMEANQVAKLNVTGKWTGTRSQYSWDKKSFIEVFQYEFDLKQEGNTVTGTSTIITSNGEYADMALEGVIVGNKLHFREFEIKGAIRPEGKVWCFKTGELYFKQEGESIRLIGSTPSYMEVYNYTCSGGYTDLVKVDNSNNVATVQVNPGSATLNVDDKMQISVFPNPFIENATITYNLTEDSKVKVEVFDISGKQVTELFSGAQKAGNYTLNFNGKTNGNQSGIFIAKMTVNGEVFSRQLVQMR